MLEYKINVIEELKKVGINSTTARKTGVFGQTTMTKFKNNDTRILTEKDEIKKNSYRLCALLTKTKWKRCFRI